MVNNYLKDWILLQFSFSNKVSNSTVYEICGKERWGLTRKSSMIINTVSCLTHSHQNLESKKYPYEAMCWKFSLCSQVYVYPLCSALWLRKLNFRLYHLGSLPLASSWVCLMRCPGGKWKDKKREKEGYCFLQLQPPSPWAVTVFLHLWPQLPYSSSYIHYWVLVIIAPNLASFNPRVGNGIILLWVLLLLVPGTWPSLAVP